MYLAVFCGSSLAVAVLMLRVSAWTNAIGAMNICVAFVDDFHSKEAMASLKGTLPFRATAALKGILAGPHADS